MKAMLRHEWRTRGCQLAAAERRTAGTATRAHLADMRWNMARMLDPQ